VTARSRPQRGMAGRCHRGGYQPADQPAAARCRNRP